MCVHAHNLLHPPPPQMKILDPPMCPNPCPTPCPNPPPHPTRLPFSYTIHSLWSSRHFELLLMQESCFKDISEKHCLIIFSTFKNLSCMALHAFSVGNMVAFAVKGLKVNAGFWLVVSSVCSWNLDITSLRKICNLNHFMSHFSVNLHFKTAFIFSFQTCNLSDSIKET